ncbi:zinc finger, CCHC-type containing protein [Tanacetum coccineum]
MTLITSKERHIREPISYLDSGCSWSMTGVKSYLHKYVEQPCPKQGTIFNANREIVLIAPRRNDVYVFAMSSLTPNGACFVAKASESFIQRINLAQHVKKEITIELLSKLNKTAISGSVCIFFIWTCLAQMVENQNDVKVKHIRTDNGTEFRYHNLKSFCDEKGISQNFYSPYTPEQNGVAKRKNRTLIEVARTMLNGSVLSKHFWTDAVRTTCYTQNRSIIVKIHDKTSYEIFRERIPDNQLLSCVIISELEIVKTDMISKRSLQLHDVGDMTFKLNGSWIAQRVEKMLINGIDTWAPVIHERRARAVFLSRTNTPYMNDDMLRAYCIKHALFRMFLYSGIDVLDADSDSGFGDPSYEPCAPSNHVYAELETIKYGVCMDKADVMVYVTPHLKRDYIQECFTVPKAARYSKDAFFACALKYTFLKSHRLAERIFDFNEMLDEEALAGKEEHEGCGPPLFYGIHAFSSFGIHLGGQGGALWLAGEFEGVGVMGTGRGGMSGAVGRSGVMPVEILRGVNGSGVVRGGRGRVELGFRGMGVGQVGLALEGEGGGVLGVGAAGGIGTEVDGVVERSGCGGGACLRGGHLKRDCLKKKSSRFVKKGKRDQDSDSSDDEGNAYFGESLVVVMNDKMTELVMDSGGSYHMTHRRDFLYDFKVVDGGSVQLGDNRTCTIKGTTKMKIQLHNGSSFILEDVRYVPRLRRSLISLGTLEKEGYTVNIQMGRIKVIKGCRVMMTGIRKKNCMYTLEAKVMTFGVQKHGGSKQVRFKQLGHKQVGFKQLGPGVETRVHGVQDEKRVWFEVELQGAQGDREAEQEKVHLGIKVGANITVTGVLEQKGAEGNVAGKKKVKESMKANLGKLLKYNAWLTRWSPIRVVSRAKVRFSFFSGFKKSDYLEYKVSNDDTAMAQRRLEDKLKRRQTRTAW